MLLRFRLYLIYSLPLLLLLVCTHRLHAQQGYSVIIHQLDTIDVPATNPLPQQNNFNSVAATVEQIHKLVPALQEQGYLSASIDSITIHETLYDLYVYLGRQYRWSQLYFDSIPPALLIAAAINPLQWTGRPLNPKAIAKVTEQLLRYCDDNGYPFARVWLGDMQMTNNGGVSARLKIDRAELRRIDTVIINGGVKISRQFLMHYLDVAKGSYYSERRLKLISQRIRELAFLQEAEPWTIIFKPGDTRLNLSLKEKKANQLNAILGLMPNNLQTGKLLLTADLQLALQNILGYGESLSASYQNLQYKSPRMKADVIWPYLFNTPIGWEGHFDFFRNDLLFRKITFQTGLRYQLNAADYIRLFYQVQSNRIINIDTATILATHQLPADIDATSNGAGLELGLNRVDYRINPHRGWQVRLNVTAMNRKIIKNSGITGITDGSGFDFSKLYDTISQSTYQYHFVGDVSKYFPLGKSLTLKLAYSGGYIATTNIFQNELFQLGGFKLLRGFDEQSIYANQYHIATLEIRVSLSQNSYAYAFSDNAYVQTKFNNYNREAYYNGFGVGTTLETKTGLFTIAYALGRSDYIPLRFRESKILFGYVAYF